MKEITKEELLQLQKDNKKILLDLFATWCQPCKLLAPKLESISSQYNDVEFVKMDINKNMDFVSELGVRSVPTVIIYNGETVVDRSIGVKPDGYYKDILNNL
jgi:thioredoxin 1